MNDRQTLSPKWKTGEQSLSYGIYDVTYYYREVGSYILNMLKIKSAASITAKKIATRQSVGQMESRKRR